MTRVTLAGLTLIASATLSPLAAESGQATPPGVTRESVESWTRWNAVLPGRLISYAIPARQDGSRDIVVLVESPPVQTGEDEETGDTGIPCPAAGDPGRAMMTLDRVELGSAPALRRLTEARDCAALDSIERDGDDQLLLGCAGTLHEARTAADAGSAELRPLLLDDRMVWKSFHPRAVLHPESAGIRVISTIDGGQMDLWGPLDDRAGWDRIARVPLPVAGSTRRDQLVVRARIPSLIDREPGDGTLLFATRAQNHGDRRLMTELIRIAPDGRTDVTESWSRLPEPEELLGQGFLRLDDRPVLWVTTKPAGKLSLFGEKRLRLYSLERDRTRLGREPILATETRMNLWQPGTPRFYDVNADGLEDLVLGFWKGLLGSTVVLDVYLREPEGDFKRSPRSTEIEVKKGDRSFALHGRDLDGDGLPDLLVGAKGDLLLFAGRRSAKGGKLVSTKPLRIPIGWGDAPEFVVNIGTGDVDLPDSPGNSSERPRLADLDGDGRPEILLVRRSEAGLGRLTVLRLTPTEPVTNR